MKISHRLRFVSLALVASALGVLALPAQSAKACGGSFVAPSAATLARGAALHAVGPLASYVHVLGVELDPETEASALVRLGYYAWQPDGSARRSEALIGVQKDANGQWIETPIVSGCCAPGVLSNAAIGNSSAAIAYAITQAAGAVAKGIHFVSADIAPATNTAVAKIAFYTWQTDGSALRTERLTRLTRDPSGEWKVLN